MGIKTKTKTTPILLSDHEQLKPHHPSLYPKLVQVTSRARKFQ